MARSDIRRWTAHGSDIRRGKRSHGHGWVRARRVHTRPGSPGARARAIAAGCVDGLNVDSARRRRYSRDDGED